MTNIAKELAMHVKIAVVQFEIQQFVPEANLKKAERFIREASAEAQIIVFPEDFVVGPFQGRKELSTMMDGMSSAFNSLLQCTRSTL
jgi:predicted amidohydrolase